MCPYFRRHQRHPASISSHDGWEWCRKQCNNHDFQLSLENGWKYFMGQYIFWDFQKPFQASHLLSNKQGFLFLMKFWQFFWQICSIYRYTRSNWYAHQFSKLYCPVHLIFEVSLLIGVEYWNFHWTIDVYLLFAIWMQQIWSKLIYTFLTCGLASL